MQAPNFIKDIIMENIYLSKRIFHDTRNFKKQAIHCLSNALRYSNTNFDLLCFDSVSKHSD